METPATYTTYPPNNPSPAAGEAGRGVADHLSAAIDILHVTEQEDAPANPSYWFQAAQAHTLIDIAQSLRTLAHTGIAIQYR